MHSIGEVVKQFEFHVAPLQHPIKGKIVRSGDGKDQYTWSISHHYRPKIGCCALILARIKPTQPKRGSGETFATTSL
jgi:hypothetical protein